MKPGFGSTAIAARFKFLVSYFITLAATLLVYGVIPFLALPSLGQVVWISGFAQSFSNAGWPVIHATNFGIPAPAPIAFGLSGAFLQSTLIHFLGMNAADAYALGGVLWLALSLAGCIRFVRLLGMLAVPSCFVSLIYLTLPIIWWHAGFSMLSFAFALLPLYLYSAFILITPPKSHTFWQPYQAGILFFLLGFLAIFTDGYTYVMFFCASGIIYLITFVRKEEPKVKLILVTAPIFLLTGVLSYLAYTFYEEGAAFDHAPLDFFRGWGADLLTFLIPSQGASWFLDFLHLSIFRDPLKNFGDPSVWMTTFALPLILTGTTGFCLAKRNRFALPLLLIGLFGFYLSLGPSLKFNSQSAGPALALTPGWPMMPQTSAPLSTGTAIFDRHLPGFDSMRASYRWCGLLLVSFFGLTVLLLFELQNRPGHWSKSLAFLIVFTLILINLPHLSSRIHQSVKLRIAMQQMAKDLKPLNEEIGVGSRVIFYPAGNDFIVNYLSSIGRYYSYNVGGDKNLEFARNAYPQSVRRFLSSSLDLDFQSELYRVLELGDADRIVIPYFDLLWNADQWPPDEDTYLQQASAGVKVKRVSELRESFRPTLDDLSRAERFNLRLEPLYAVISLRDNPNPNSLRSLELGTEVLFREGSNGLIYLKRGWAEPASTGVWSLGELATLSVVPKDLKDQDTTLTIVGSGFLRPLRHSQEVDVWINKQLIKTLKYTSGKPVAQTLTIPRSLLASGGNILDIEFSVKYPNFSWLPNSNQESRQVGFQLFSLKLEEKK